MTDIATAAPAKKTRDPLDESSREIDWGGLLPRTLGEITMDAIKLSVFSLIIINAWAIAHHSSVTQNMTIAGWIAGLVVTLGWKSFVAVAEAYGPRVVGVAYLVLGVACCGTVLWYASAGESVTTSNQLRRVIQLIGVAFLYPAVLGLLAIMKGDEAKGVNPLGFPLHPRWFSTLWVLFSKEVRTFFTTGVPYIIIVMWTSLNGLLFFLLIPYYTRPGNENLAKPGEILASNGFLLVANWFIWPAITMRLVAEEKRQGTIETLLTVPVTDVQVIFSKYLAAMAFFAINLVPFLGYHCVLAPYARDWDWGPIFAEFLGLFLWGSMALSIGLFYSTLTDSQLVAFILSAFTNVALWFISAAEGFMKEDTTLWFLNLKSMAHYFAVNAHYSQFVKGVVSTQDVAYFVGFTGLALFASIRGLEAQRWK